MITSPEDRELWEPRDPGPRLANERRNGRTRELYLAHIAERAAALEGGTAEERYGKARGDFARDWVALAQQIGLHVPGQDRRTPLAPGQTQQERCIDAARTRQRQFTAGANISDWLLTGIEATIADRAGMALPGEAYQQQERLPV